MAVNDNDKMRLNQLLDVLLKYTMMDFSHKAPLTDKGDEIDAISAGINALVEELEYRIQKLKESEERFRVLIEDVKDYAIFLIDPQGIVMSWNKGAENIYGHAASEIIGNHFSIFYTKEEVKRGEPEHNLEMATKNGRFEAEGWRRKKSDKLFWVDVSFTALYDSSGVIKGFSKVTKDTTVRKANEDALKDKREELARSNSELEQFAYVASHDLQEPLRMVTSYVQLLAKRYKGKLDQDADDFIAFAVDGSNRMRTLINSLLEYSRVNREKPFEKIDLNILLSDIKKNLDNQIEENEVKLAWGNLPLIVGDPILIGQLFQNLISNAIKFKSDKKPDILIESTTTESEFQFSVKDNGIGMQQEYFEKIFVIFQRLHSKEKYPGTGIGLAICKKIVERHGGKIWVESKPDEGSVFRFTIKKYK
ncbi:MAG: PAS domain S-box protein [Bacteroidetes bacterium]|nr:PAS domain S-box protein [Bacteroidota bacterium]